MNISAAGRFGDGGGGGHGDVHEEDSSAGDCAGGKRGSGSGRPPYDNNENADAVNTCDKDEEEEYGCPGNGATDLSRFIPLSLN